MTTSLCQTHDQQRHIHDSGQDVNAKHETAMDGSGTLVRLDCARSRILLCLRVNALRESPHRLLDRQLLSTHSFISRSISIIYRENHSIFSVAPVQVPAGWAAAMLSLELSNTTTRPSTTVLRKNAQSLST